MNKISFDLEYCHGINKLSTTFDFTKLNRNRGSRHNTFVVYAPNGTMKTSFTKTLRDLKEGKETKDYIYPERITKRSITKSDGSELEPNDILVVESYKDNFEFDKVSNLLASPELKKEYDTINKNIEGSKNSLIKYLYKESGLAIKYVEGQFSYDFSNKHNKFLEVLENIYDNEELDNYSDFSYLKYKSIINKTVEEFIENEEVRALLHDYIQKYNELMINSNLF